ncbi:MAG: hypothetical protein K0B01_09140, partial [Syntrophobacterales bacterium]|nr:hypothetical protein [Syntrophobacterales bacterium]
CLSLGRSPFIESVKKREGAPFTSPHPSWLNQIICPPFSVAVLNVETLISTRHKRGYKLNFAKENVLILKKQDILLIALAVILRWNELFSDFILDIEELLILC